MSFRVDFGARLRLPVLFRVYTACVTVLMVCSWLVAMAAWKAGHEEAGGMWSHFSDRFLDIEHYDRIFVYFHQARFFQGTERFAYPAPAAVVYDLFLHLGVVRLGVLLSSIILLTVYLAWRFGGALVRRGFSGRDAWGFASVVVVTSWPLVFLFERANIEIVVFGFALAGADLYWRGRLKSSAICWGLAASLKLYPVLLLLVFVNRRQRSALLTGLLTFATAILLSFWFVGPTMAVAARGTLNGIHGFVSSYGTSLARPELRFDHSYLALIKSMYAGFSLGNTVKLDFLIRGYFVVASSVALVLYFARFRSLPSLNRYMLAVLAMISLPPVSYDYTLIHLYPSFALLAFLVVDTGRSARVQAAVRVLFGCFALLLSSENFLYTTHWHFNGPIKAVALLAATIVLLRTPLVEVLPETDGPYRYEDSADVAQVATAF